MLGWVITCHDDRTQEILDALEKEHGALPQYQAVNFWRGLASDMLSRIMRDALYKAGSGEGVIFLTDVTRAPLYYVASLLSHRHSRCEVISGVTLSLIEQTTAYHEAMASSAFREYIARLGASGMSSFWHQQQKDPPFALKHNSYEYQLVILMTLLLQ